MAVSISRVKADGMGHTCLKLSHANKLMYPRKAASMGEGMTNYLDLLQEPQQDVRLHSTLMGLVQYDYLHYWLVTGHA